MPVDHTGNSRNGNALHGLLASNFSKLNGRITNLPIYELAFNDFKSSPLSGDNLVKIVQSIKKDDIADAAQGYRQPTNHDDRLGNLPVAPGGGVEYREYYLPGNGFAKTGYLRIVADIKNKRLFVTPTHYDVWLANPAGANPAIHISPAAAGARNPFFLITGVVGWNQLFWW